MKEKSIYFEDKTKSLFNRRESSIKEITHHRVITSQEVANEMYIDEKGQVEIEVGFNGNPYFGTLKTEITKDTLYIGIDTMGFKFEPINSRKDVKGLQDLHLSVELSQEVESLIRGKVMFVFGDAKQLPFQTEVADRIIFKNIFNANPDEFFVTQDQKRKLNLPTDDWVPLAEQYKLRMAQEALRVLKSNGKVIIYTYTPDSEMGDNPFLNGSLQRQVSLVEEYVIKASVLKAYQPLPIERMYIVRKS